MDVLVAILIAGGIISIGAHLIRRSRDARDTDPSTDESFGSERQAEPLRGLEQACPGDVVVGQRADLIVERVLRLTEGSACWTECELRDGEQRFALVLHPSDPDHALLGEAVSDLEIFGDEPPESIDHGGRIYTLERCGQARTGSDPSDEERVLDHWLYGRPGDARIWLRRTDGELTIWAGSRQARHLLELIPA